MEDLELQSPTLGKLASALCKAQAEIKPATKNKVNPFFKSAYADIEACFTAALPALSKFGLAFIQTTIPNQATPMLLVTTLIHESGEWIRGVYPVTSKDTSPQSIGSALTYAKRYAFCAITGLATEDDDGNDAQGKKTDNAPERPLKTQNTEPEKGPSEKQLKRLYAISKKSGWSVDDVKKYLSDLGLQSSKELNHFQYERFCQSMEAFPKPGSEALQ